MKRGESINNTVCTFEFDSLSVECLKTNILPTFSCSTENGKKLRILLDSGAQTSFILSDLAEKLSFPILNSNINLVIKGINSSKSIRTNVVDYFPAVCIPVLGTKPAFDNLNKVNSELRRKGYILADTFGSNPFYKSLDLILGVDSFPAVSPRTVPFGTGNLSCYLESNVGIIPIGNGENFLRNLNFLEDFHTPNFNDFFNNGEIHKKM